MHTITSEELRSEPSLEETLSAAGASGGKVPIGNQDGDHHWEHVRLKEFMAIKCYDTDQPQQRVKRSRDRECNCRPSSPAHLLPSFNIFCFFVGHSTSPLKCRERRIPLRAKDTTYPLLPQDRGINGVRVDLIGFAADQPWTVRSSFYGASGEGAAARYCVRGPITRTARFRDGRS